MPIARKEGVFNWRVHFIGPAKIPRWDSQAEWMHVINLMYSTIYFHLKTQIWVLNFITDVFSRKLGIHILISTE